MALTTLKGNTTISDGTGNIGTIRSISVSTTQGVWDTTANDTTTARTYLGTWSDGTLTISGLFDNDDATHKRLEAGVADATADTYTITFRTGDTWAASCIITEFTVDGDYEGGWTYSVTLQKSGDATWTAT